MIQNRKLRTVLIYTLVFLLVFFWTVPVAFTSSLVELQNLTKIAPFLKPGGSCYSISTKGLSERAFAFGFWSNWGEVFDKIENYILCIYRPEIWINKKQSIYHAFLKPASINDDNRYETYFYHFCFNYSRVLFFLLLYLFLFLFQCWSLTHLWKVPLRVSCQVSLC